MNRLPGNLESLVLLELETVHEGLRVADLMLKEAPVEILTVSPIPPGRFLIFLGGGVGEAESVFHRGLRASQGIHDRLFLAEAHSGVLRALEPGRSNELPGQGGSSPIPNPSAVADPSEDRADLSLGLFETETVSSAVHVVDRVLKSMDIEVSQLHLARGMQGKSFGLLTGRHDMVEAALDLARACAEEHGRWVGSTLLPRPDTVLRQQILQQPWGFLGATEIL